MRILAIDTSTDIGSIAISEDDTLKAEYMMRRKTHTESLMPMIDDMLKNLQITINDIQAVLTTLGPGSFTGLRIGLATAKGICYARKIPLKGFSTLLAMAYNVCGAGKNICPILEAGRDMIYTAIYSPDLKEIHPPQMLPTNDLTKYIGSDIIFVGSIPKYLERNKLGEMHIKNKFAPIHLNFPRAASLFEILRAQSHSLEYDYEYISSIEPLYIRRSSAQEKLEAKKLNSNKVAK
jgi:tRNA threonylcarbamoyl adenosine modification protein YeaZ